MLTARVLSVSVKTALSSQRLALSRSATSSLALRSLSSGSSEYNYVAPPRVSKETSFRFGLKLQDFGIDTKSDEKDNENDSDVVAKQLQNILSLSNASQHDLNQCQIAKAIEMFQRFPGDTGSSEVQIAVLTQKIIRLTEHFEKHKKDKHSKRGLIALVERRKKLMQYLKRKDLHKFRAVVTALGIRFR